MNSKRRASIGIESIPEFKDEQKSKNTKQDECMSDDEECNDFSENDQKSCKSSTKSNNENSLNNDQSMNNISKKKIGISVFFA